MSSDRQKPNNVPDYFPALLEAMAVQQNSESLEFMFGERQKRMLEGNTTEVPENRNS